MQAARRHRRIASIAMFAAFGDTFNYKLSARFKSAKGIALR
jgi:hypothetical protein